MSAAIHARRPDLSPPLRGEPVTFERGLVGFPEWRHFLVGPAPAGEAAGLFMLQCLDPDGPVLLAIDPRRLRPDYQVKLSASDLRALQLESAQDALVLCTLTVREGGLVTANLLGPLVINPRARLGRQVVIGSSTFSARFRVGEVG